MEIIIGGSEQRKFGEMLLENKNRKSRKKLSHFYYQLLSFRNLHILGC